jgi:peptidoglycan/LPS O-acetylase OafA/YrhL
LTLSAPRSAGLDTLRSLAILSVIVFHIYAYHGAAFNGTGSLPLALVPVAKLGWIGVDLFFVLSGYLIGSQLLKPYLAGQQPGLSNFYRNRLYRVLPAYWVVVALYFLMPAWTENPGHLSPLWEFLTFTWNLVVDYRSFSHVWSLCIEEHFYLLLPLIVLATMRKPSLRKTALLLGGLVLFGICIRTYFLFHLLRPLDQAGQSFGTEYMQRIYYPTYSRLDGLLAGVTLALVKTFRPAWWSALARRGHSMACLGLALAALALYLFQNRFQSASGVAAVGTVIGFPVLSIGLGLLVASALSTNGLLRFKIPGAKRIATLSYTLYLTHKALIHLVDQCFPSIALAGRAQWMGLYAVCCLVVAATLHLTVERPFLLLRDRRAAQRSMCRAVAAKQVLTFETPQPKSL